MRLLIALLIIAIGGLTFLAWMQDRRIRELKIKIEDTRRVHEDLAHYVHVFDLDFPRE